MEFNLALVNDAIARAYPDAQRPGRSVPAFDADRRCRLPVLGC